MVKNLQKHGIFKLEKSRQNHGVTKSYKQNFRKFSGAGAWPGKQSIRFWWQSEFFRGSWSIFQRILHHYSTRPKLTFSMYLSKLRTDFEEIFGGRGVAMDVPDIQFRLARYPAVFYYPVPVPVPAQLFPGTGYLNRIIVVHRCGP